MEFKAITTQEEFDTAIKERLTRQKETLEKQYADYAEMKATNIKLETEIGTLKTTLAGSTKIKEGYDKDLADLNAKIAGYETANLRTRIALENGIPYNLAGRLVGEDEESITADAKALAGLVNPRDPVPPLRDLETNTGGADGAYKSLLEGLNLEGE